MRILLTGANGFIGSHLVAGLLDAGHQVVGAVRDPVAFRGRFPRAEAIACDLNRDTSPAAWRARLQGVDAVVNCAGVMQGTWRQGVWAIHTHAPNALFDACAAAGVRRVVQVSAISVGADTDYARSKRAADAHLMALPLDWVVLRPSLVYAEGAYGGTSVLRAQAALPGLVPVIGSGEQAFSPLHARDLARVVAEALARPDLARKVLEVVGPERLTQRELLLKLRAWLGLRPAPLVAVPLIVARFFAALGSLFGAVSVNRNALVQLEHGNAGDPAPLRATLGWLPEPMDAWLARHPAQVQDRVHAELQVLRPSITVILAALWIGSGVVGFNWAHLFVTEVGHPLGLDALTARAWAYALASLDILIGLAVLLRWQVRAIASLQSIVVVVYTVGLSVFIPGLWNDPYGALLKNLAVLALIPVWAMLEDERG
jgi:uncharacterized protein YbjT (DUF2867 family)